MLRRRKPLKILIEVIPMQNEQSLRETMKTHEEIYDGRVLHVFKDDVELPNGQTGLREYVRHIGAAAVLPITEAGEVLLVKQFRYPFDKTLLEIPAGKRDSFTENPLDTAMRELKEETGATCHNLIPLGEYYSSPAILDEVIWMYLAKDLTMTEQSLDEDEFVEIVRMPFADLLGMVERNEIRDGKTQAAVLKAARILGY